MNIAIDELIERATTRRFHGTTIKGLADKPDVLTVLNPANNLELRPIWDDQVDDIEGPLYAKYIADNPTYDKLWIRKPIVAMLDKATQKLPIGWRLIVRATHRPLKIQLQLLQMVVEQYRSEHPKATAQEALDFARLYVSDPEYRRPPHCSGAAVDVDAIDIESGQLIDFGTTVNTDSEASFLDNDIIDDKQHHNRRLLLAVMLDAGFAPYFYEWWHFSYGDQIWAEFYNKKHALYGIIEPEL